MSVVPVAALVATTVLVVLAALQVLVACGQPYGRLVWGGQRTVLPGGLRFASAVSVVLYAAMALVLLGRAELMGVFDDAFVSRGSWVLTGYFGLGTLLNLASRSRSERVVMSPACAVLTVCALVVARG